MCEMYKRVALNEQASGLKCMKCTSGWPEMYVPESRSGHVQKVYVTREWPELLMRVA